jgi:hypothetical protein
MVEIKHCRGEFGEAAHLARGKNKDDDAQVI